MVTVSSGTAPEPGRSATSTLWLDGRRRSGTRLRCPTPRPGTACEPGDLATRSRPTVARSDRVAAERGRLDVGIAGPLFMAELRRSEVSALRWADCPPRGQTHGLPPKSGTVTAAARRVAPDRRYRPARLPRRMEGTTRAVRPTPSACRSSPLARAGARRQPRRRRGRGLGPFDGYPPTPALPPVLAARPSRPRGAPGSAPPHGRRRWPPCHGSRTVRSQPVREAWSTGAEAAGAPLGRRAVHHRVLTSPSQDLSCTATVIVFSPAVRPNVLPHRLPYTNSTFTRRPTIAAARCKLPSVMSFFGSSTPPYVIGQPSLEQLEDGSDPARALRPDRLPGGLPELPDAHDDVYRGPIRRPRVVCGTCASSPIPPAACSRNPAKLPSLATVPTGR